MKFSDSGINSQVRLLWPFPHYPLIGPPFEEKFEAFARISVYVPHRIFPFRVCIAPFQNPLNDLWEVEQILVMQQEKSSSSGQLLRSQSSRGGSGLRPLRARESRDALNRLADRFKLMMGVDRIHFFTGVTGELAPQFS